MMQNTQPPLRSNELLCFVVGTSKCFLAGRTMAPMFAERFLAMVNDFAGFGVRDEFFVFVVLAIDNHFAREPLFSFVIEGPARFRFDKGFGNAGVSRLEPDGIAHSDSF